MLPSITDPEVFAFKTFDFIKIDAQGSEIPILKGGMNVVRNATFILLEVPFFCTYNEGVGTFQDHISFMDKIGFFLRNHFNLD